MMERSQHGPMADIKSALEHLGLTRVKANRFAKEVTGENNEISITVHDARNADPRDVYHGTRPGITCSILLKLLPSGDELDPNSREAFAIDLDEAEKLANGNASGSSVCHDFDEFNRRITALLAPGKDGALSSLAAALAKFQDADALRKALDDLRFRS